MRVVILAVLLAIAGVLIVAGVASMLGAGAALVVAGLLTGLWAFLTVAEAGGGQ